MGSFIVGLQLSPANPPLSAHREQGDTGDTAWHKAPGTALGHRRAAELNELP